MTIHYHGTPISPRSVLHTLAGRNFCVSFADPRDVRVCHEIGQSVMLDNGAFSAWTRGEPMDWEGYRDWCAEWLTYGSTWAVIPDVIDGDTRENDYWIERWPFPPRSSAPVWHMHEPLPRLIGLARAWPRVCIGSSAEYREVGSPKWHARMTHAMNWLCADTGYPPTQLHMLRGMAAVRWHYPFASVDSTDVARNHNRGVSALEMAQRWDTAQCPGRWEQQPEQMQLCG